jgi:hypothetical protein
LEIVLHTISQHAAPISIIIAFAQKGDRIVLVEKSAKAPGNLVGSFQEPVIVPIEVWCDPTQGTQRAYRGASQRDVDEQVDQRFRDWAEL